jgi:hypothetical protein
MATRTSKSKERVSHRPFASVKPVNLPDDTPTRGPAEFAEHYSINQQNVYYWMRVYNIGHKEGTYWKLDPLEQGKLLAIKRASDREKSKRVGGTSTPVIARSRASASAEAIAKAFGSSIDAATQAKLFIDKGNDAFIETLEEVASRKNKGTYIEDLEPENIVTKRLIYAGLALGVREIRDITVKDRYSAFRVLVRDERDQPTIVYHILKDIYFLETQERIFNDNENFAFSKARLTF